MTKRRGRPDAIDPALGQLSHTADRAFTTTLWHRLQRFMPQDGLVRIRRTGQFIYASRLQPQDGLLLSYPKSGSTWVRNMLAIAIAAKQVPPSELAEWVPPLHLVSSRTAEAVVLRSHDSLATPGFDRAGRIVVLARDPRALAVSWAHHQQQRGVQDYSAVDGAADLVGAGFLSLGSWHSHMRSALDRSSQRRMLIVRYEDMMQDPIGGLARLCEHFRIDTTSEIIELAVRVNTPSELRTRLVESGVESSGDETKSVVRSAAAEAWRDECPAEAADRILTAAGREMTELGFDV